MKKTLTNIISIQLEKYILWKYLPLPFLRFFDGESKNSFEDEQQDGGRQIPIPGIVLNCHHSVDGNQTVNRKYEASQNGFDCINKICHFLNFKFSLE
jgi:hypothetical protein